MKNIVLTGFMGTGKTAVGEALSKMLGMKLVDIDAEIVKDRGIPIPEIFEQFGEKNFRDTETEIIKRFAAQENSIISTGGGAVLKEENMEALRKTGMIFTLSASPEVIFERTKGDDSRPLLKSDDPMKKIRELLEARKPFYEKAGIEINTEGRTPFEIAEEIAEMMKWKK